MKSNLVDKETMKTESSRTSIVTANGSISRISEKVTTEILAESENLYAADLRANTDILLGYNWMKAHRANKSNVLELSLLHFDVNMTRFDTGDALQLKMGSRGLLVSSY